MPKRRLKKIQVDRQVTKEFTRARWKHLLHWVGFAFLCLLVCVLVINIENVCVIYHKHFQTKDFVTCLLVIILVMAVLPSLVFEVHKIKINDQGIYLANLLFSRQEKWENVISINNPIYLKFVILRTKTFFYLLNKRDLPNIDDLISIIQQKVESAKNSN